jgi:hypothetical protein
LKQHHASNDYHPNCLLKQFSPNTRRCQQLTNNEYSEVTQGADPLAKAVITEAEAEAD